MKQPIIRRLRPGDLEAVAEMFNRLSPLTRVRRFFSPTESGPAWELRYLAGSAEDRRLVLIAETEGRIVGLARYVPVAPDHADYADHADSDHTDHADVAIVVEDDWQRRGLGRRLMGHLAVAARQAGIRAFDVAILGDNDAALGLMLGTSVRRPTLRLYAGVFEGSVPLVA